MACSQCQKYVRHTSKAKEVSKWPLLGIKIHGVHDFAHAIFPYVCCCFNNLLEAYSVNLIQSLCCILYNISLNGDMGGVRVWLNKTKMVYLQP